MYPEIRVSLPISTVGRRSSAFSTWPTAWPRRSMKSGVIGGVPTVPRMPSVPK
jgi:hypothetical protein